MSFFDINDFKNLKPGDYFVEPKYDGIRVQLRKAGYKVWILTDSGNDITEKLPNIAEEARTKIPFNVCVLDCELAAYRALQRLGHSAVTAFLRSATPAEDYHLRLKPFDILLHEGADMRQKELADRKKIQAKVPWSESIHPVKYKLVKAEGVIPAIKEMTTSEGAMIKDASSKYNRSGEGWYKWKKQYEIDAQVIAVDKKSEGYIYNCRVGSITIGDIYLTQVKANVGDIITVSVDHITKKEDGTWGWYAPKVREVRDDKKEPDPLSVLQKIYVLHADAARSQSSAEGDKNDIQDGKNGDDFVDIEVAVLSTNVTGNGRQYVLEDLQKNAAQLNSEGGLIFAMGRHPGRDEEPDASDNVGIGQTYMENNLLKSKARIYNTSTFPDMVKRIKFGLVRDVSIEGMVSNFKKICSGDGCWQRAFGLMRQRAVFVHSGADPHARIERILESLEGDLKKMTDKKQDKAPDATAEAGSTPASQVTQAAPETVKEDNKIQTAEAGPKTPPPAAPVIEAAPPRTEPAVETAPSATETAPKPDALEKVLGECAEMKKMMSDMIGIMGEMKNMMGERQIQPSAAREAVPAAVTESKGPEIERPPRVKESRATPNAAQSSFLNEIKKLVR